jgi:hypothetical protein
MSEVQQCNRMRKTVSASVSSAGSVKILDANSARIGFRIWNNSSNSRCEVCAVLNQRCSSRHLQLIQSSALWYTRGTSMRYGILAQVRLLAGNICGREVNGRVKDFP